MEENIEFTAFLKLLRRQIEYIGQLFRDGKTEEAMKWLHDLEVDIKTSIEN